jgi:hypothetical protein
MFICCRCLIADEVSCIMVQNIRIIIPSLVNQLYYNMLKYIISMCCFILFNHLLPVANLWLFKEGDGLLGVLATTDT